MTGNGAISPASGPNRYAGPGGGPRRPRQCAGPGSKGDMGYLGYLLVFYAGVLVGFIALALLAMAGLKTKTSPKKGKDDG